MGTGLINQVRGIDMKEFNHKKFYSFRTDRERVEWAWGELCSKPIPNIPLSALCENVIQMYWNYITEYRGVCRSL